MLKYRLLTAALLIPIFILAIWLLPFFVFVILLTGIFALSAWEWSRLVPFHSIILQIIYVIAIVLGFFLLTMQFSNLIILSAGVVVLVWGLLSIFQYEKQGVNLGVQFPGVRVVLGFLFLIPSWLAIMILESSACFGRMWLLYALIVIWAADTGAYFIGRWRGKHLLAPRVSPKKTWEGFFWRHAHSSFGSHFIFLDAALRY